MAAQTAAAIVVAAADPQRAKLVHEHGVYVVALQAAAGVKPIPVLAIVRIQQPLGRADPQLAVC